MYPWLIYAVSCYAIGAVLLAAGRRIVASRCGWIDCGQSWSTTAVILLFAPVWVPIFLGAAIYAFVRCFFNARRALKEAQSYREAMFQPIELDDLPDETFRRFQRHSNDFLALGMEPIGDYFNKPDPVPVWNRYFLGFGGTVFGDLTDLLEECATGFFSVLADGTYVETAGCEELYLPEPPEPADGLRVQSNPSDLKSVVQTHLEAVRDEAQRRGVDVLAFAGEQVADVAIYGQRKFYTWRTRAGEDVGQVPAPVAPSGRNVPVAQFVKIAEPLESCAV